MQQANTAAATVTSVCVCVCVCVCARARALVHTYMHTYTGKHRSHPGDEETPSPPRQDSHGSLYADLQEAQSSNWLATQHTGPSIAPSIGGAGGNSNTSSSSSSSSVRTRDATRTTSDGDNMFGFMTGVGGGRGGERGERSSPHASAFSTSRNWLVKFFEKSTPYWFYIVNELGHRLMRILSTGAVAGL